MEEKKRKKETKVIERNGEKIKVQRYEGDENWTIVKDKEDEL